MAFVMLQAFDRHIKSIKKCIFSTILKKWILRHFNTGGRRTDVDVVEGRKARLQGGG